jgi:ribose 5-phosphate isomerase A
MSQAADPKLAGKYDAARKALAMVQGGMCLGLGSGSTAAIFLELLGEKLREGLQVTGVPTSSMTETIARKNLIPLIELNDAPTIDLVIDGADEIDPHRNMIKGGGGALLREKVVAAAAERRVYIADESKMVKKLGAFPLPVEVVQFAWKLLAKKFEEMGAVVTRRESPSGQPFTTDEGNYILDCRFGLIEDPATLAARLSGVPGVMEHGLFVGFADEIVVGRG